MAVAETRRRNPEATRASILEAAEREFVDRGFAGVSMSDIARGAGVTKSLIHHHFGSKEDLWNEVKRTRFSHYAEVQRELMAGDESGTSVLRRSVEVLFDFLRQNPEYVRLNSWMNLEDPSLAVTNYPDLISVGVERVREEQRAGRLRSDIDAQSLIIAMLSMCSYWFTAKNNGLADLVADVERQPLPASCGEITDGWDSTDRRQFDAVLKILMEGVLPR